MVVQASNETKPVASGTFETLRKYDSATVANVIELFRVRASTAGHVRGSVRAIYPDLPPIVGYATTATFRAAYPSDGPSVYDKFPEQLKEMGALPEPKIAVIQDLDDPPMAATLGEVMCRAYKRFGCVGIITSGGARDILAVRQLNFPVFASSIIVSHGYCRIEEVHTPVWICGLTVHPGEIIHADANGVVLIPNDIAEQVAGACEEFVAIEKVVMDYLERTDATPEGYLQAEKTAGDTFDQLSARLRSKAHK
jgi:4-hydroxy-4-methyl-2-oxoglutarate aldolase